jgi:hypothetical protein
MRVNVMISIWVNFGRKKCTFFLKSNNFPIQFLTKIFGEYFKVITLVLGGCSRFCEEEDLVLEVILFAGT